MRPSEPTSAERTLTVLEEIYQRPSRAGAAPSRPPPARGWRLPWERLAAPLTLAVGVLAFGVGVAQVRSNIRFPAAAIEQLRLPSLRELISPGGFLPAAAGTADTDGDGLLDADEAGRYGSSVYLEDTDSDGVSDAAEVAAGADPACPAGQDCRHADLGPTTAPAASPTGAPAQLPPPPAPATTTSAFDAAKVRAQLQNAGLSAALLSSFSDQQLEAVYQEVLQEPAAPNVAAAPVTSAPAASAPRASPLTAVQLRPLLREAGVPPQRLDQMSNAQLEELRDEILRGNPTGP